ncbi:MULTISPECIES: lactococcin 972 family bacteriocin [unclassified Nocardiopsis]|uniref:lactococcin 972 family bacteriocin n=1 Tax=unclassified Nocardiopsis TaxID=2649073 RepID=UPI0013575786|nr:MULTISPECIES: lactococcin 972 family bacteriocin [unclassified Nocardiopsis]
MPRALRRAAATVLIAAGITVGTAGAAAAVVSYVGGGTWYHGVANGVVYSNYYHPTQCHGSTAVGAYTYRSPAVLPGRTSIAEARSALSNNQTYWRTCG